MATVRAQTRRITVISASWVAGLSGLGWWWLYVHRGMSAGQQFMTGMSGKAGGMAAMSHAVTPRASFPADATMLAAMWPAMIVAMMLPSATPLITAHRFVTRDRGRTGVIATTAFAAGYLLTWMLSATIPLALLAARDFLLPPATRDWALTTTGALFIGVGLFQYSSWKARCLTVCRSPLAFVLTHDFDATIFRTILIGCLNGLYCLGCCWLMMLTQLAVAADNLIWMGILTLIFLAERTVRVTNLIVNLVGSLTIITGIVLIGMAVINMPLAQKLW
jgi:predicted metal-binding membrane protein